MKAVIIEDETTALYTLKEILKQNNVVEIELIADMDSIKDSVEFFKNNPSPDIIFMDIMLADGIAFKIFEEVEIYAPVIFTTAFDEYALQAFQVVSVDYLLKPLTKSSVEKALKKFQYLNGEEKKNHALQTNELFRSRAALKHLLIVQPHRFYPLSVDDISFFYTTNDNVTAWTKDGNKHPIDRTLDTIIEQLNADQFFRANRQFIISRNAIKDVDMWYGSRLSVNLLISVPERIVISKNKSPIFKKWLLTGIS